MDNPLKEMCRTSCTFYPFEATGADGTPTYGKSVSAIGFVVDKDVAAIVAEGVTLAHKTVIYLDADQPIVKKEWKAVYPDGEGIITRVTPYYDEAGRVYLREVVL